MVLFFFFFAMTPLVFLVKSYITIEVTLISRSLHTRLRSLSDLFLNYLIYHDNGIVQFAASQPTKRTTFLKEFTEFMKLLSISSYEAVKEYFTHVTLLRLKAFVVLHNTYTWPNPRVNCPSEIALSHKIRILRQVH